ncbi:MAG: 5'-methylthioadenosine/S-adenosylhomocysteine nucleosidase [Syntrophomonadaceae bacterium]|nr:5'-methylthioadenosine/S-adenosylhomocysteine nucleosidase [Bacillota bacterium]
MSSNLSQNSSYIGIIASLEREAKPLIDLLQESSSEKIAKWEFRLGRPAKLGVVVSYSGCGKILAAAHCQLMIERYKPDFILHYGTAGAISPKLRPGDIILGNKSVEVDYCEEMIPNFPRPESLPDAATLGRFADALKEKGLRFTPGTILCQDADVVDQNVKNALWSKYRGECTCWEGIAVGRICNLNSVPYLQLRGITDLANDREEVRTGFESRVIEVSRKLAKYLLCGIAVLHNNEKTNSDKQGI